MHYLYRVCQQHFTKCLAMLFSNVRFSVSLFSRYPVLSASFGTNGLEDSSHQVHDRPGLSKLVKDFFFEEALSPSKDKYLVRMISNCSATFR